MFHRSVLRRFQNFLVISATFPPRGGSSVQRVAKFVKFARLRGFNPIVLTTESNGALCDKSLLDDLPPDIKIHRVSLEPFPPRPDYIQKGKNLFYKFLYPDEYLLWGVKVFFRGALVARKENISCVFVSFGSPSALLAGIFLSRIFCLPIVVDIRDMWTQTEMKNRRQRQGTFKGLVDRRVERLLFRHVDHFTVVSEGYAEILSNVFNVSAEKVTVVYNGVDIDDLTGSEALQQRFVSKNLTIRFAGFVTEQRGLANLLCALSSLNQDRRNQGLSDILFELMGGTSQSLIDAVLENRQRPSWLKIYGYHPHREALAFIAQADILALLPPPGNGMLTGKLFEYIGVGKPIIHLDNRNAELRSIIEQYELGRSVEQSDITGIAIAISEIMENLTPNRKCVPEKFQRRYQADQFIEVIESLS